MRKRLLCCTSDLIHSFLIFLYVNITKINYSWMTTSISPVFRNLNQIQQRSKKLPNSTKRCACQREDKGGVVREALTKYFVFYFLSQSKCILHICISKSFSRSSQRLSLQTRFASANLKPLHGQG